MNKKIYQIMSAIVLVALTLGSYSSAGASAEAAVLPSKTITSPQTFDCGGQQITSIVVKNTHDVTIQNCTVTGSTGRGISVDDSSFVTIRNVTITKVGPQSGAISLNATSNNGLTHDIVIEDYHAIGGGSMGWAIGGSQYPIKNITVRRVLIEDAGNAGAVQTHGMYISNWQSFLIEDVTILRSWNAGLKIVGDSTDGIIRRVVIKDSGRSGSSGPGISLGDSRISHIARLKFEYCDIQNSIQPAIWILDTVNPVNDITVDHCYFKNNYLAVMITNGAKGWKVTNNVAYNQTSYAASHPPVYIDNTSILANNFFDYNNWYYDGLNPARISSTALTFAQWQAKGVDLHSVSLKPGSAATAVPSVVPTVTRTPTRIPTSTTSTVSPVTASPTPTTSSVTASPTPTSAPETIYDDKHSSFAFSSDWKDVSMAAAYGGSFKKTTEDASSATFTFTGQSFSVLYTTGPNFGNINVYIDNVLLGSINENAGTTVYQKRWNYSGQLSSGSHTLKLVVESPNGSIDAVIVRSTASPTMPVLPTLTASPVPVMPTSTAVPRTATAVPVLPTLTASPVPVMPTSTSIPRTATAVPVLPTSTPVPPTATAQQSPPASETTFDNKHSSFVYSSDWKDVSMAAAYGGSFKKTTEDASSSTVTFTFTGQSFSVLYTSGPNFGNISVYIDNVLIGTINESGGTTVYQKRWNYSGQLTSGVHKLKLVVESPNGSIDAVIVR